MAAHLDADGTVWARGREGGLGGKRRAARGKRTEKGRACAVRVQAALTGGEEETGGGEWMDGGMDPGLGLSRGSRAASPVLEIHLEDFPVALEEPLHIPLSGLVAEAPDVDPRHLHGPPPSRARTANGGGGD